MGGEVSGSQAVERALDLLVAFGADEPGLSLSELSGRAELTPSTARRLLKALQSRGFIEQDALSRQYRLGVQLTRLGHMAEKQSELGRRAHEPMSRLVERTGEAAYLARLAGPDVMYVYAVHSREWVRLTAEIGQTYPAWATASGRVLLAELGDEEVANLYREPVPPFLGRYAFSLDELLTELERVRSDGFAQHRHDQEDDVYSIAAPVFDGSGTAGIALTVSGPGFRYGYSSDTAQLIRGIANEISYRIGGNRRSSAYHAD